MSNVIFRCCANGHDLTVEGAFLYSSQGFRSCRLCEIRRKTPKNHKLELR